MLLADISLGDILWSLLAFFFFFIWIMILFQVIGDLFRDHTTSGAVKALWCFCLVFFMPLTVLVYLIVNGSGMQQRALEARQEYVTAVAATAGTGNTTDQIAKAKELLDAGAIDQAEFDQIKAKALA